MRTNREELLPALQRKAYYGVGVVMSLGQDTTDRSAILGIQARNLAKLSKAGSRLRSGPTET